MTTTIVFENARVFDGQSSELLECHSVVVSGGRIVDLSGTRVRPREAHVVDVGGRTLMPGLIDVHVHAYASDVSVQRIDQVGEAYRAAHAVRMLENVLESGFTTVRDIGGGDYNLWRAIEDGLIRAPRFFYAGKILSMTGGHGDFRLGGERQHRHGYCSCEPHNAICVVADGVDECIKAAREELRRGAHCVKIAASGGIASPTDPIWMNQYREDEVRAIVQETKERRTYTAAHCHPASAIRRSVEFGVRCIEHGTLIDDPTASFVAERGAYVVPTVAILQLLVELGHRLGFPSESQAKAEFAFAQALAGLESMRRKAVKLGFGTDLLGETHVERGREFTIRREVFTPVEILRQVTSVGAEILMKQDELGCVKVGALADLIVVDGDPLADISLLADGRRSLPLIMRGGELIRNRLV